MKFFNCVILTSVILVSVSCKKKEYPESTVEGSPVFNCSMNVNGTPVNIEAGINNYYMFSSYQQDSNGVYGFNANLKQNNCTNCPNSLSIQINDFKVSALNANTLIDSALITGNYNYLASTAASFYSVQFQSAYNKSNPSYLWNFGDGTTSTSQNPNHIYKRSGKYKVGLSIVGGSGCVSNLNVFQNIGILNYAFRTNIIANNDSFNIKKINFNTVNFQGTAPYTYKWDFGDGTFASSTAPTISHTYPYVGSYPVSLLITDANNNVAQAKYNVVTANDISSCATNYTISSVSYTPNILGLSNIIINWTDANGIVYSSRDPLQPGSSYFNIVSVESFKNNDNNQLTKKLHVKFSCTVYNGTNAITISNAEAVICVAYK